MKQLYFVTAFNIFLSFQLFAQQGHRVGAPPSNTPIHLVGDKIFSFEHACYSSFCGTGDCGPYCYNGLAITDTQTFKEETVNLNIPSYFGRGQTSCLHNDGFVYFFRDDSKVKAVYVTLKGEVLVSKTFDIPAEPVSVHSTADGNIMVLFMLHKTCSTGFGRNKYYTTIFSGDYLNKLTTYSICDELLTFCKAEMVDNKYTVFTKVKSTPTVSVYSWVPHSNEIECEQFEADFYVTDVLVKNDQWLVSGTTKSDFTDKEIPVIAHVDSDMEVYEQTKFEQLGLEMEHKLTNCYLSHGPYNTYWLSTNYINAEYSYSDLHENGTNPSFSQLNQELEVLQTFNFDLESSAAKVLCVDSNCFFTFWGWFCGSPYFKHLNIGDASLFNNISNEEEVTNEIKVYPQIIVHPNPVTKQTQLTMPAGKTIIELNLYTPKGRLIELEPTTENLSLENFSPGIYNLKAIDLEGNIYAKKLVKL